MNPSRFPDPADTAPAGADAPRTFASICDVCLRPAAGDVLREGEDVYLRRRCAEHGERRLLMSRNGDRFVRLDRAYHRLFPPDVPPQPTIDTCYFITNRCNQACSYCATEAGRYPYFGDMDAGGFRDALAGHRGSKVSLIGGEPLVHPRFFDFAEAVGRSGKTLVIYTNGLGLGDDAMLGRLAAAAPKLEIRMTFEGFPEEAYGHLEGRSLRARKIGALRNLERRGVSTVLGHTLLAGEDTDASRRALRSIVEFAMTRDFVRGLTFQSAVALGGSRHLAADDMLSVDGVIDRVVDALPVPVPREVAYPTQKLLLMMARLFGLPMCSYVQTVPLFRTRRGWVSLDHFFDLDRLDARLDALVARLPRNRALAGAAMAGAALGALRPGRSPALVPLVLQLLPVFMKGYDFESIPRTALPLVSISVCDRHNYDASVMRRCEKNVQSSVDGRIRTELCSEMVLRHLRERVAGEGVPPGAP